MKKIFSVFLTLIIFSQMSGIAVFAQDAFEDNHETTAQKTPVPNQLSPAEKLFNGEDTKVTGYLRQVGYDVFSSMYSSGVSSTGKFDNSYKISIGEKINVYLYGESVDVMSMSGSSLLSPSSKATVDSKGDLFINGIGLIHAENRTIGEVEATANKMASSKYRNLKVKLTVSSGTDFVVFIYGEVKRPGKVLIGNNSSILDALGAAGGVKRTGTLRNIIYEQGKTKKNVDLYRALFFGDDKGIIVRPGDKIFVGKLGNVVALKNGVPSPGIYEVKQGEKLSDLVKFAGGYLPETTSEEITMTELDKTSGQRNAKNISFENVNKITLKTGDSFEFKRLYNSAENTVVLQGNIKHPATFAYKDGMRLSDILTSKDELLEETFINQAVIRRISGDNNTVETIPVFLKDFFDGISDPLLKPRDVVTIYKNTNSAFVDVYGCIDTPKHLTYATGMTLADVMTDVKFLESSAVKTSKTSGDNTKEVSYKGQVTKDGITLSTGTESTSNLIPVENIAVEITGTDGASSLYYLYDIMINSDKIKTIKLNAEDKIFFRTLRENEIMKSVKVSGFVKNPGVYTFVAGKNLTDLIETAGGLTEDADLRGLVFKRANLKSKQVSLARKNTEKDIQLLEGRLAGGYKQEASAQNAKIEMISMLNKDVDKIADRYNGQISLHIKDNDLSKISDSDNLEIQDGDDIYIPKMSYHVSVIGEVYNEQSFAWKKGKKNRYYIKEVGGYTPNSNKFRMYKVGVDGRAERLHKFTPIEPGDTIVVPRKIAGNDWITPICSTLQGLASLFLMFFGIHKW